MSVSVSVLQKKALNAYSAEVIRACALKYGFDCEEAMRELSVSYAPAEGKKPKATGLKKAVRVQPSIPLPFTGVVREDCCIGVKQNHGLYTQCFSAPGDSGLCKGCAKQASKNASGEPDCGVIAKRVMQGSEYRDSKGRAPVHYTKVMNKQKLTEEQVLAEAAKFGIEIEASHFAVPSAQQKRGRPKKATTSDTESETSSASLATGDKKKTRGRPKKAAKVVEVNATEDLFASLMEQAQSASPRPSAAGGGSSAAEAKEDDASSISASDSESDSEESKGSNSGNKKKTKKSKALSEEQLALAQQKKAAKFLAKEAEKEAKAAAKAQAQQEKEAEKVKKAAEKEQAQQEKALAQQKKLAEKEQAQQEKALAQQKKLAEKEAEKQKKAAEKAEKEAAKAAKAEAPKKEKKTLAQQKKAATATASASATAPAIEEPVADLESESEEEESSEVDEPVVAVKKFEHEGVTYLKSSDGVLYDAKTQSVVGKWNDASKSIEVYDGESEEEDSDSDSDDE
jgi:hypothetical protein